MKRVKYITHKDIVNSFREKYREFTIDNVEYEKLPSLTGIGNYINYIDITLVVKVVEGVKYHDYSGKIVALKKDEDITLNVLNGIASVYRFDSPIISFEKQSLLLRYTRRFQAHKLMNLEGYDCFHIV